MLVYQRVMLGVGLCLTHVFQETHGCPEITTGDSFLLHWTGVFRVFSPPNHHADRNTDDKTLYFWCTLHLSLAKPKPHTYNIYIYIYTHTYIYIHIHTYTYIYTYVRTYVHTYIYIHVIQTSKFQLPQIHLLFSKCRSITALFQDGMCLSPIMEARYRRYVGVNLGWVYWWLMGYLCWLIYVGVNGWLLL